MNRRFWYKLPEMVSGLIVGAGAPPGDYPVFLENAELRTLSLCLRLLFLPAVARLVVYIPFFPPGFYAVAVEQGHIPPPCVAYIVPPETPAITADLLAAHL